MGWKNWPYWVRGGIIGFVVYIIGAVLVFLSEVDGLLGDWFFRIFSLGIPIEIFLLLGFNIESPFGYILFLASIALAYLIIYVALGAIIGLIIGKIRGKK